MTARIGVATQALHAHSKGSREASDHLAQLADLLEQARVSDDCFGPIGELMAYSYFNSLEECQGTAKKAGQFMDHMARNVTRCAENYTGTDQEQSANLSKIDVSAMRVPGSGPGTLGDVNGAGGPPGGFWEQTAGYGSSWASTSQGLSKASSPPDIAIATVNARMEQLNTITSPGQAFIDNGLGFLVSLAISPLVELVLEPAIGDPEQMRSTGKGWEEVAQWVEKMGEHETDRAEATAPVWEGRAGDAFRAQMHEFTGGATALANDVRGLKEALDTAADVFDAFVEMCVDIIQEFVMGLIIEWLAALAASWITAGASVGAASGLTAAQTAITSTRLGTKVANLLHKLKPLITKLEDLLQAMRKGPLSKVCDKMNELRNGNVAQQWVARQVDANPLVKMATRGENVNLRKAERVYEETRQAAERGEKTADDVATAQRHVDAARDANKYESTTANRYAEQSVTDSEGTVRAERDSNGNLKASWSGEIKPEHEKATGEKATATNAVQAGLNAVGLNGEHRWQDAVINQSTQAVVNEGGEQLIKQSYDESTEASDQDQQAAQERGFSI
ncbi:uncharacterized protein YukE [Saccharopolyspora lacisalsi]|uniref:Uncharacterized protein YukE n=1 Tax=Halosaccharopolyspora lacisalsi TaxID=1000566 RepID=A0A839DVQ9_9PSEU|nr:type VII secretion target [Halosaccharopolyspora lacisalsi]MBA8825123.1 uncharacterized protein YukE [Halosaccharopolyspora lacisalsi]